MNPRTRPIKLPTEDQIRTRLSTLALEANGLRRLLRVLRDQKRIAATCEKREVSRAS